MAERKGYEGKIAKIDAKIKHICKELENDVGLESAAKKEWPLRLSREEIDAKILEVLKNAPQGISQIGPNEANGVNYGAVANWLK